MGFTQNQTGHLAEHDRIAQQLSVAVNTTGLADAITAERVTQSATIATALKPFAKFITPQQYGAVGDGVANDTVAVQAAITAALTATNPVNLEKPPFTGNNGTVFLPLGTYLVDELQIPGTIRIVGAGGGTYANSTLLQRVAGTSIVRLKADTDGSSNSTVFENVSFKSMSGTTAPDVAQVIADMGITTNSVYFHGCWFKSPETWAIWLPQGDDIQITGCTFDVAAYNTVRLGSATGKVTNATIANNTFYNVAARHIQAENVRGLSIVGNRAYSSGVASTDSVFLHTGDTPIAIDSVTISGNEVYGLQGILKLSTTAQTLSVTGNTFKNIAGYLLALSGGGVLYGMTFTGNACATATAFTSAAFTGVGCGLQVSVISHNTVIAGATTPFMFDMSDARVTGNIINSNASLRFTANSNFAAPAANGA